MEEEKYEVAKKAGQIYQFIAQLEHSLEQAHGELNTLESMLSDILCGESVENEKEEKDQNKVVPLADILRRLNNKTLQLIKKIKSLQKRQELQ